MTSKKHVFKSSHIHSTSGKVFGLSGDELLDREAIISLRAACFRGGSDNALRIYGEATSNIIAAQMREAGLVRATRQDITKLMTRENANKFKRNMVFSHDLTRTPPGTDHGASYKLRGSPYIFVSQPYQLDMETLNKMLEFAKIYGLRFTISGGMFPAPYFPGGTLVVVWKGLHHPLAQHHIIYPRVSPKQVTEEPELKRPVTAKVGKPVKAF